MKGKSICQKCGIKFNWRRPDKQGPAKLCSNKCKPKYYTCKEVLEYQVKMFNQRVVRTAPGCWDWDGIIDTIQGYAKIHIQDKNYSAHRISWIIHNGSIPQGKQINHHCDNRRCTNPEHLYLGTQQENDADRIKKKRQAKGSSNGSAKLTEEQVQEIKKLLLSDMKDSVIAQLYKVSPACIWLIRTNKKWKHVNLVY